VKITSGIATVLAFGAIGLVALSARAQTGKIVINEVYYDSPGEDHGCFLELKGAPGSSLNGFSIQTFNNKGNQTNTIKLEGSIPKTGFFVLAQDKTVTGANQFNEAANLVNSGGAVQLVNGSSIVDAVAYGNAGKAKGEGKSAPDAKSGSSLARIPDGMDSDNNAKDFRIAKPSPGMANDSSAASNSTTTITPTATPSTPQPTTQTSSAKRRILFDLTKHEAAGNSDWRIDGGYSEWADALKKLGFEVSSLTGKSISSNDLNGAGVLVIPEPQNPFSDTERNAIVSFVAGGGGLLMISDHRDSDRDNDGWDSPEVFNGWDQKSPTNVPLEYQKSLDTAKIFGLSFSLQSSFQDPVYTIVPLTKSPILEGVGKTGIYVGTSVDVTSGTALMGVNGKTYFAVNTVQNGRVAAYGDSSMFSDGTFSDGTRSKYNNWANLENAKLAVNMVRWLAKDLN
jgi:hypothetical protein